MAPTTTNGHPDSRSINDSMEPIAIIGMACRFPGEASTVERFWKQLVAGRTAHSQVPPDRFDAEAWYHPNHERHGSIQPRSGFFLQESPAVFDAPFFSITANHAAGMCPMQRKLLEVSYEAFENGERCIVCFRTRQGWINNYPSRHTHGNPHWERDWCLRGRHDK